MRLDPDLLAVALQRRETFEQLQDDAERARSGFHRAVRHLYVDGTPLREIADALGLSHQRVHQIVGAADPVTADEVDDLPVTLICSFCGRTSKECAKLIAGPHVYICDRCAVTVRQVGDGATDDEIGLADDPATRCSFCGKQARKVEWMAHTAHGKGAQVCNECLHLVEEILRQEQQKDSAPHPGR
ncbi:MAG: ClpX C4-type zinc finger protein [Acidimicrobiales bacterium]